MAKAHSRYLQLKFLETYCGCAIRAEEVPALKTSRAFGTSVPFIPPRQGQYLHEHRESPHGVLRIRVPVIGLRFSYILKTADITIFTMMFSTWISIVAFCSVHASTQSIADVPQCAVCNVVNFISTDEYSDDA